MSDEQDKEFMPPTVEVVSSAIQLFEEAQARQVALLLAKEESEARMLELQQQAEEAHLAVVEAESEIAGVAGDVKGLILAEQDAEGAYRKSMMILEEAQKLVAEKLAELDAARHQRAQIEQHIAPQLVRLGAARTTYERFIALAGVEAAKLRKEIAVAEEEVSLGRLGVCEARLQLLQTPAISDKWSEIKGLLEGGN